ncbi:MAG: rhodanese-like domain-containing protein [Candidatus Tectomicrobia bacterium]|uniref:Rhodanese-like domain-containing protein n=1 Tax=Tectimicrobiota bacterium TaxID=2528274 RepID=A0A932FXV8_UNCTE|nr:rhodanese-like domain-containing protein [Candidatus Tectomicrobia bacterium]
MLKSSLVASWLLTGLSSLFLFASLSTPSTAATCPDIGEAEAQEMARKEQGVIFLDVRTPQEYAYVGHIPGATNLPWALWNPATYQHDRPNPAFEKEALSRLDKGRKYIVYCRSGGRSRAACNRMATLGYTVFNLKDGFEGQTDKKTGLPTINGWKIKGYPYTYEIKPELVYRESNP